MDERFDLLLSLLEASIKKNGDKPITINHLINLMKMVNRKQDEMGHLMDLPRKDDWMWKD